MTQDQIITATKSLLKPNKGISLQEEALLMMLPPLKPTRKSTAYELVRTASKVVKQTLGRDNITPRDLKKAVFRLISV